MYFHILTSSFSPIVLKISLLPALLILSSLFNLSSFGKDIIRYVVYSLVRYLVKLPIDFYRTLHGKPQPDVGKDNFYGKYTADLTKPPISLQLFSQIFTIVKNRCI